MVATFWVLTLFVCPDNVLQCTPFEMYPKVSIPLEQKETFSDCERIGKFEVRTKKDYVDFGCHPHQR
jgi:hypothetical protein